MRARSWIGSLMRALSARAAGKPALRSRARSVEPTHALTHGHLDSRAVEVVRERAGLELRALLALALARARAAASTSSTRSRSTTTAPSASSTTTSPCTDRRAGDLDRLADRARSRFSAPRDADVARPDGEAELSQLLDVAHGCVHEHRGDATRPSPASRAARRRVRRARARASSARGPHPGCGLRDGRVHHEVVVLAAADGSRRPGGARAGHDLDQRRRRRPGRARPPRGPSRCPAARARRSTSVTAQLTTCGVTRWNASAYRIAELPEERRAWLPRCSARCA